MLRIEIVDSIEDLERLRAPWNDLLRSVSNANPYQSPAFIINWFEHFATDTSIHMVTIRQAGRLVAVAPFELRQAKPSGVGALRLRTAAAKHVDYGEPLLADDVEGLADALLDHLAAGLARPGASVNLHGLRDDGALLPALGKRSDLLVTPVGPPLEAAILKLDALEDPVAHITQIARKNDVLRKLRKLGEQHETIGMVDLDFDEGFELLTDLLGRRWPKGEGPREFATEARLRFTRSFSTSMAQDGYASIKAMHADGHPVWLGLLLRVNKRAVGQTLAIGENFMKFGPGIIGVYQMIDELAQNGDEELDMLSGDYSYKLRWANAERSSQSFLVVKNSAVGRVHLTARDLYQRRAKIKGELGSRVRRYAAVRERVDAGPSAVQADCEGLGMAATPKADGAHSGATSEPADALQGYYQEVARLSDPIAQRGSFDIAPMQWNALVSEVVSKLEVRTGDRVLDVGAGSGLLDEALVTQCRELVSVDVSLPILRRAQERVRRVGDYRPVQGSAFELPFSDNSFDRVLIYGVTPHFDGAQFEASTRECVRVAKPGGIVLIGDNNSGSKYDQLQNTSGLREHWRLYKAGDVSGSRLFAWELARLQLAKRMNRRRVRSMLQKETSTGTRPRTSMTVMNHSEEDALAIAGELGCEAEILVQDFRLPYARWRYDLRIRT